MIREEDVQTLMELGLTLLQAKTYLALSALGNATIKKISKATNIAKQDVYRIMPKLQQLGLAEKIVAPQATFKAVNIENGTSVLLKNKEREYTNLQKKTKELIDSFKNANSRKPIQEESLQFSIISERFLLLRILDNITDNVQETIDFAHFWEFTRGMLFKHNPDILKRALERGVRIRWITETHKEDQEAEKILKTLTAYPLFKIRYVPPPIPLRIAIYDKKDAIMCLSHLPEDWVSNMWSNNKMFVKAVANCHEQMWNSASEEDSEKAATRISKRTLLAQ